MNDPNAGSAASIARRTHLSRFTPSLMPPETLEAIFVQREELAVDTVDRIRESVQTDNKHHLLFVGPRGCGKTHFAALATHRVDKIEDLKDRLRIAWLNEDETSTSFLDLQLRVYGALNRKYPDEFPESVLDPLYDLTPDNAAEKLSRKIIEKLEGRTALIVVENLDALFDGLGTGGQHEWRAFLQEHPHFAILATAQQLFPGVSGRESPFFGFFQIDHFRPLSIDEATLLLTRIARLQLDSDLADFLQTPTGRSRVRALYHLSGGNHRVFIVLSEFIDRQSLDELIGPFEKMLDELTPYYQQRLRWLSPQQRKIVEHLCGCHRPVPVKEIARVLFTSNQSIATQLKDLREKRYVQSSTRGRESLYELTEPLMRMAMELKENRGGPIRLIVDFLRIWYDRDELEERMLRLAPQATRELAHLRAAIAELDGDTDDPVLQAIIDDIEQCEDSGDKHGLIEAREELVARRGNAADWLRLSRDLSAIDRHEQALAILGDAAKKVPEITSHSIYWWIRGSNEAQLGRHESAIESGNRAVAIDPESWSTHVSQGWILLDVKRHEEALIAFDRAIALRPDDAFPWTGRGIALSLLDRLDDATTSFERALEINGSNALGWSLHGAVLSMKRNYEEAINSFDHALNLDRYVRHAAFDKSHALLALDRWTDGFRALKSALRAAAERGQVEDCAVPLMVGRIFLSTQNRQTWSQRLEELIDCFASANALTELGEGLVESLTTLDPEMTSEKMLESWLSVWHDLGKEHKELSVSLRMFETGIRYLQTGDRTTLLDLNVEERAVLEQVFEL